MFTFGFHNALSGDREYDAMQISQMFDGVLADGVFATFGDAFIASAADPAAMQVKIGTGRAWFNHTWSYNSTILAVTVPPAEIVLNRIDTIVLEVNNNIDSRTNSIKVISGTPAETPVAPTLVRSELINQYPICDIYVGADVSAITADKITNRVGTSDTPMATGLIDTIDSATLLSQWDSEFHTWNDAQKAAFTAWMTGEQQEFDTWQNQEKTDFEAWVVTIKDILDAETAGNLLLLIEKNETDIAANKAQIDLNTPQINTNKDDLVILNKSMDVVTYTVQKALSVEDMLKYIRVDAGAGGTLAVDLPSVASDPNIPIGAEFTLVFVNGNAMIVQYDDFTSIVNSEIPKDSGGDFTITQKFRPIKLRCVGDSGGIREWDMHYDRNPITISTSDPSGGVVGDIWIKYTP